LPAVAGVSAPAAVIAGPERELVAERRVCSVLFCDVVGFTPLSESRDPEAVRELLSRYFETARIVIARYGGVVEKFIGDAVMAVWGTPVAAEGDAERAVRAALELVDAVAALGADVGVPGLAARAGVVTGEVAATIGAVNQGMVAGDTVNTAARVQASAEPGTVLVDGATQRLAGSAIGFADAGAHRLKGKAEPEPLWQATRVLSGVGGLLRVDGLEAPLIGREAELRTVKELFHAAAERQVPRLLLVSGPAGVGKSRLGWEFEKYIDGLAEAVWWHRGRCLSYGDGVAFWALAEIVRQRLGIAEEDSPEVAAGKLASGLDRFVPDPDERAYVGVRLGRLLGVAAAGDGERPLGREELFAGWRLFFERLAAQGTILLLVEDAQHADAGLLDFLDHLIDWARDLPLYVLVLARPELGQARPGFGVGRNRTTLTLDPLDHASMDRLVDALVPGMPPAARAAVTRQAQGIPLFAVETVRALIDRDIVQPSGGVYRLVGDVGELAVPGSLHALLAARLDALDPAVRRLVTDAAVLGTSFPAEALIAVSGQDEAAVRAALAELVRREVFSVSADPLSPERGSYQFAQQMLRQVAYDTLSRRDRKARHLTVAAHLRAAFPGDGEEVIDVIARHYLDALAAIPDDPDIGEIRGQAIAALVRAAERAERTGAFRQATTSYASAAGLVSAGGQGPGAEPARVHGEDSPARPVPDGADEPDVGRLWERAALAAVADANWAVAIEHADHARDHYLERDQPRLAVRTRVIAGRTLRLWGRLGEGREHLTTALEVLRPDPDTDTVQALTELATLEVFAGSPEADRLTTEALTLGQALGVGSDQIASLLLTRAIYLGVAGQRRPEAVAYLRESARLAEAADDNFAHGRALLNLSDVITGADPAAGAEAARAGAVLLRRAGARDYLAVAIVNLVQALFMLGDWDGAGEELSRAIDSDGLADIEQLGSYRAWLAALRGDAAGAKAMLDTLGDLLSSEDPQERATISLVLALIAASRRQHSGALRHAKEVLELSEALSVSYEALRWAWPQAARSAIELADGAALAELLGLLDSYPPGHLAPMLRAERELVRARLAARDGDPAADAAFTAATGRLRELSTPYHLAHGLLDHAQRLVGSGDADAATAAVEEARTIAQQLRCQPLLDRAEAMSPAAPQVRA
jgi:class 3 adenylate cyclase/tetratricopeptide (TPR) repeat protein